MNTTRRHHRDHPLGDPRVAAVLAAAAAPTEPGPVPGEEAALAAFRAGVPTTTRRTRMRPTLRATAVAATATGALLVGGAAAAGTGTLPGAAQDTARDALAKVGVTVPGPAAAAADHPAARGTSASSTATAAVEELTNAHGQAVSGLATTTELAGREKGAAISELASEGKSRAGDQPAPEPTTTTTATNADGQTTAADRSGGRSSAGTAHRP